MKKFLIYFCLILLFSFSGNASFLLTEALTFDCEKEKTPTVVFDLDDVVWIPGSFAELNEPSRQEIQQYLPNSTILPYVHKDSLYHQYLFYPNIGEVFLTILSWEWNLVFFSSGCEDRGEKMIPAYLRYALAPYSQNIESEISLLMEKRVRIFSKKDMKKGDKIPSELDRQYEVKGYLGIMKKDLRVLNIPLENCFLIDDNSAVSIGGEQYPTFNPYLLSKCWKYYMDQNKSEKKPPQLFEDHDELKLFEPFKERRYYESDYAAFQLGILAGCKDYMEKQGISLREALRNILKIDRSEEDLKKYGYCICVPSDLDETEEGHKKISTWIKAGRELIESTLEKRYESKVVSDPYKEIAILYKWEKFLEKTL